jgi:hypothetical protein
VQSKANPQDWPKASAWVGPGVAQGQRLGWPRRGSELCPGTAQACAQARWEGAQARTRPRPDAAQSFAQARPRRVPRHAGKAPRHAPGRAQTQLKACFLVHHQVYWTWKHTQRTGDHGKNFRKTTEDLGAEKLETRGVLDGLGKTRK